ncbi:cysteine desulfurase family protein [Geobacter metallireducens RCH3]|uniref:cysteine desulfurase n=1 Tax=Geobacter metallireducens (strain ATCC 53774 / DSM 7210 / GS-15) TaxID=269799 RepID=Q39W38_GEOMG|nr:aminotransferase class V-fold PLP-dependent enzyme [Geobacter metallireducens]ABB31536.1 cysteine desulfurase family protein [Geobacter metallireducens GS-15]EHP88373.1 cysteine desulfurase family protein [Geobacter metallireducens RCH3]
MSLYLDNAATSYPKPEPVYEAVNRAMRDVGVSPGRGGYRRGIEASRLLFETRESVAALFGIGDSSRVVFTHSATEALNLAVLGLVRPGDHVVTTSAEHNSLVRPLHLAGQRGVEISWIEADRRGFVSPDQIAAAIRPSTRLIALAHCSNVTGAIQPVTEIAAVARRAGVLTLVDAAQSAGMIPLDVSAMGIDLLAAPGHKGLMGPPGTGILCVAEGVDLEPLFVGGTGGYSSGVEQPDAMPERFESGTHNLPGIAGLGAGVDFIRTVGLEVIRKREEELVAFLMDGLGALPGVTCHGPLPDEPRGGLVSFTVEGVDPQTIGFRLDQEFDICVRVGLHCAPAAHRTIGTYPGGAVRVSPGYFTTDEEIGTFLQAMGKIISSP